MTRARRWVNGKGWRYLGFGFTGAGNNNNELTGRVRKAVLLRSRLGMKLTLFFVRTLVRTESCAELVCPLNSKMNPPPNLPIRWNTVALAGMSYPLLSCPKRSAGCKSMWNLNGKDESDERTDADGRGRGRLLARDSAACRRTNTLPLSIHSPLHLWYFGSDRILSGNMAVADSK